MILGLRETSFFIQWIFLELTIISFLPLLVERGDYNIVQRGLKYFLRQSPASVLLLVSLLLIEYHSLSLILPLALFYKIGIPPFHGWVISIIRSISLKKLFILITIPKIIPMLIIIIFNNLLLIEFCILYSIRLLWINSGNLRRIKMLIFLSSVARVFWPLSTMLSQTLFLEYIIAFTIRLIPLISVLSKLKLYQIKDVLKNGRSERIWVFLILLRVGGVPPFLGFIYKIIIISVLTQTPLFLIILLLAVSFAILYLLLQVGVPILIRRPSNQTLSSRIWTEIIFFIGMTPMVVILITV